MKTSKKLKLILIFLVFGALPGLAKSSELILDQNGCKYRTDHPLNERSVTWTGLCKDGFVHGIGQLKVYSADGKEMLIYDGNINHGHYDGKGVIQLYFGKRLEGEFVDNEFSYGVMSLPNGDTYTGSFLKSNIHGKGTYRWSNGTVFEGEWENWERNGFGKVIIPRDKYVSIAGLDQGRWDGEFYIQQGIWEKDKFINSCNNKVACSKHEWIPDEKTGCTVWNKEPEIGENITWSGGCKNNRADGRGKLQWFLRGEMKGRYEGEMREGKSSGRGVYYYADGQTRDGQWEDGEFNRGTVTWANGSRYIGEFWKNKFHGFGTLSLVSGDKNIASWKQDGSGKWVGDKYIVQGKFSEQKLRLACSSPSDCDAIDHRNAQQQNQYNENRCKSLYVGKPVTLSYQFMGDTYAEAVIIGVGAGVAAAKVIGGSAYETQGYGIGSVHERVCSEF